MTEELKHLPSQILLKSIQSGKEHGWKREDFNEVVSYAVKAGLAIVGGQVQFKLPHGTCELYWQKYEANARVAGEGWISYCNRTKQATQVRYTYKNGYIPCLRSLLCKTEIDPYSKPLFSAFQF